MTEPTPQASLAKALAAFQASLPKVAKESQGNRGKYADLADLSPVVLPALAAHGLSWSTKPTLNEQGMFVLRYTLRHVSGEFDTGDYPLCDPASSPQAIGSTITYARRYALTAVTGVAPGGDDDDAARGTDQHRAQQPPAQRQPSETRTAPPARSNGNGKPEPTLEQRAAGAVPFLLAVETDDAAEKALERTEKSPAKDINVSGLLSPEDRETLGLEKTTPLTLLELAMKVTEYVARHKRGVRADAKAVA